MKQICSCLWGYHCPCSTNKSLCIICWALTERNDHKERSQWWQTILCVNKHWDYLHQWKQEKGLTWCRKAINSSYVSRPSRGSAQHTFIAIKLIRQRHEKTIMVGREIIPERFKYHCKTNVYNKLVLLNGDKGSGIIDTYICRSV